MQKFTIELEELACKWLVHISEVTGKPIERMIEDAAYNQIAVIEHSVSESFTDSTAER